MCFVISVGTQLLEVAQHGKYCFSLVLHSLYLLSSLVVSSRKPSLLSPVKKQLSSLLSDHIGSAG